ncbi:hypothetical protein C8J57DRAFT_1243879 [Mycena rebaudengoi]|nr:hypothetical protein C8J57DRAFT_1243879 [Mycena rebaudengoi]
MFRNLLSAALLAIFVLGQGAVAAPQTGPITCTTAAVRPVQPAASRSQSPPSRAIRKDPINLAFKCCREQDVWFWSCGHLPGTTAWPLRTSRPVAGVKFLGKEELKIQMSYWIKQGSVAQSSYIFTRPF